MESVVAISGSSEGNVLVDARRLYQHDPLLVLLKERWRLRNHWVVLLSCALPAVVFSLWGVWLFFKPVSHESLWTLHNTISALLQVGVVFPVLFLLYIGLPGWLADLFNQLQSNQVIGSPRNHAFAASSYPRFVYVLTVWISGWWWSLGALALNVVYLLYRFSVIELPAHMSVPLWLRCLNLLAFAPLMYATFLCIARVVVAFVAVNWLLWSFTIRVRLMHPDGSGGLGALGRLMWLSVVLLLWDAVLFYTGLLSENVSVFSSFEISLVGGIYLALVPLVFIGWLLLPHMVMVKARDAMLQPLADEMDALVVQTTRLPLEETETMKATSDRLLELQRRYDFVQNVFPTWPLEVKSLSQLTVALILPPLLPVVLPWLFSLLGHLWMSFK